MGFLLDFADRNLLVGNMAAQNEFGYHFDQSHHNSLIYYVAAESSRAGFATHQSWWSTILGNTATASGAEGFRVFGAFNVIVQNRATVNAGDGLSVRGPGSGHIVEGNDVEKNGGDGIALRRPNLSRSCAYGSSGAAGCGAGGVMAWERGRRRGGAGARGC